MRTRAIASLRRPVASALPVTTGLRAAWRASASAVVSVVYSDTCSAAVSAVSTPASSTSTCVPVDSATVSFLVLPPRLLIDALHRLMGMVRARVYLQLAQHAPAQRVLR